MKNTFDAAANGLGAGIDALFTEQAGAFSFIALDMIEVRAQVRETFEDEGNTLADLAEHIKEHGVLQPILLRATDAGYLLIAGERRFRACKLAGLDQIPAYIREMTDEQADDAQFGENIHRLNLTQIEEAKKIQRDLDTLGSVEAVLAKHNKSRAWLSKILALLNLPEQAERLVSENISADLEVINTVKTIEKVDPTAAKELVDDLKATQGKESARKKVEAVKDTVKPTKKTAAKKAAAAKKADDLPPSTPPKSPPTGDLSDGVGQSPFEDKPEPASTEQPAPRTEPRETALMPPGEALGKAYTNITEFGASPKVVLDAMDDDTKEAVDAFLYGFYAAGTKAQGIGRAVLQGFANKQFATEGEGAFALVAFLYGADSEGKFNLLDIFGSLK